MLSSLVSESIFHAFVPERKEGQVCMRTFLPRQARDAPVALCLVMHIKVPKSMSIMYWL